MKKQINEYFACNDTGYTKIQNVQVKGLKSRHQLPVTSRCNEILPFQLHNIQFRPIIQKSQRQQHEQKDNLKSNSVESYHKSLQLKQDLNKKNDSIDYSFAYSHLQNPSKIMERDQVRSIHLQQKNSQITKYLEQKSLPRTKDNKRPQHLTKSSISYINSNRKQSNKDMKKSLCSTINSNYQRSKNVNTKQTDQNIEQILKDLMQQKSKRKDLQQKYKVLTNMIQKNQRAKTSTSDIQQDQQEQPLKTQRVKNKNKVLRKHSVNQSKNTFNYNKVYVKQNCSNNQNEQCQQEQLWPIIAQNQTMKQSQNQKLKRIKLTIPHESRSIYQTKSKYYAKKFVQNPYNELLDQQQIKQNLNYLTNQIDILHENINFLQDKVRQQQIKYQKQILQIQLREKQAKIQQMMKENQKIKEINQVFLNRQLYCSKQSVQSNTISFNISKNSFLATFIITFLIILLLLNIKQAIC